MNSSYLLLQRLTKKHTIPYRDIEDKEAIRHLLAKSLCTQKQDMLCLDPLSIVFMGIALSSQSFSYSITDLSGRKLLGRYCEISEPSLEKQIAYSLRYSLLEARKEGHTPLACGISYPGTISTSPLRICPYFSNHHYELTLPSCGNIPIYVISNIHCLLWSEVALFPDIHRFQGIALEQQDAEYAIVTSTWSENTPSPARITFCSEAMLEPQLSSFQKTQDPIYLYPGGIFDIPNPHYSHDAFAMGAARFCELAAFNAIFAAQTPMIRKALQGYLHTT